MRKERVEAMRAGSRAGEVLCTPSDLAELCNAWLENVAPKPLPAFPCEPLDEANKRLRVIKDDNWKMMQTIRELRAENERLRLGAGGGAIQLIDLLVKRLPADADRLSKLEAEAEAARDRSISYVILKDSLAALDRNEGRCPPSAPGCP